MVHYTANDYDIWVGRDRSTQEYVALVHEFPSLSWVSFDRKLAAAGMKALLADILSDMYTSGEYVPEPGSLAGASRSDVALV